MKVVLEAIDGPNSMAFPLQGWSNDPHYLIPKIPEKEIKAELQI